MSDEKPREFWIYDNGEYFGSMVSTYPIPEEDKKTDFKNPDEIYHVIEYSAYHDLKAKLEVAVEALRKLAKPYDVSYSTNYQAICEYDVRTAEEALQKIRKMED